MYGSQFRVPTEGFSTPAACWSVSIVLRASMLTRGLALLAARSGRWEAGVPTPTGLARGLPMSEPGGGWAAVRGARFVDLPPRQESAS